MPSSTALLSYGVALSCFAASVSGANAVPARDGFRRVMRRQSHGIELAADELVARDLGSNSGAGHQNAERAPNMKIVVEKDGSAGDDEVMEAFNVKAGLGADEKENKAQPVAAKEDTDDSEDAEDNIEVEATQAEIDDRKKDEASEPAEKKRWIDLDDITPSWPSFGFDDSKTDDVDEEEDSFAPYREEYDELIVEPPAASDAEASSSTSADAEVETVTVRLVRPNRKQIDIAGPSAAANGTAPSAVAAAADASETLTFTRQIAISPSPSPSPKGRPLEVIDLHDASADTRDPTDTMTRGADVGANFRLFPAPKPTTVQSAPVAGTSSNATSENDDDDSGLGVLDTIASAIGMRHKSKRSASGPPVLDDILQDDTPNAATIPRGARAARPTPDARPEGGRLAHAKVMPPGLALVNQARDAGGSGDGVADAAKSWTDVVDGSPAKNARRALVVPRARPAHGKMARVVKRNMFETVPKRRVKRAE